MRLMRPSATIVKNPKPGDVENILSRIEEIGRTCYKSEAKMTADSAQKFIANIIKQKHESVLEHHNYCFEIARPSNATVHQAYDLVNLTEGARVTLNDGFLYLSANVRTLRDASRWMPDAELIRQLLAEAQRECALFYPEQEWKPLHFPAAVRLIYDEEMREYLTNDEYNAHSFITVRFIIDRGCCYDDETEILTRNGWKLFSSLILTDEIACMSGQGELEWHTPQAIQSYRYKGDLLRFENSSIDLLVTPNHKMWVFDHEKRSSKNKVWKFIEAQNLKNSRYVFSKTCSKWRGIRQSVVIPPHPTKRLQFPQLSFDHKKTGDLFELLGLWITDGSYRYGKKNGSGSCLSISQSKVGVRQRIRELCEGLGLTWSEFKNEFRIDNIRLVRFVEGLFGVGAKTFSAQIPALIKEATPLQIKRFLRGAMLGDGNTHVGNGHQVIYTSSYVFAGDLQELYLKIGLSANIRTIAPRERGEIKGVKVNRCKVSYVVSVHGVKRSQPMLMRSCAVNFGTPTTYDGVVWCATVPHHRLYVRRNGKAVWSGNSHELVRHRPCAFSQESTRFCNYKGGVAYIIPNWVVDVLPGEYIGDYIAVPDDATNSWLNAMWNIEQTYLSLLADGWPPQEARSTLPNSLKTEIVMTARILQWQHVINLRARGLAGAPHPQMKEVMVPLASDLNKLHPQAFAPLDKC